MLQKRDQCPTSLWETKGSQDKAFVNAPEEGPMPHVIVGDEGESGQGLRECSRRGTNAPRHCGRRRGVRTRPS